MMFIAYYWNPNVVFSYATAWKVFSIFFPIGNLRKADIFNLLVPSCGKMKIIRNSNLKFLSLSAKYTKNGWIFIANASNQNNMQWKGLFLIVSFFDLFNCVSTNIDFRSLTENDYDYHIEIDF